MIGYVYDRVDADMFRDLVDGYLCTVSGAKDRAYQRRFLRTVYVQHFGDVEAAKDARRRYCIEFAEIVRLHRARRAAITYDATPEDLATIFTELVFMSFITWLAPRLPKQS